MVLTTVVDSTRKIDNSKRPERVQDSLVWNMQPFHTIQSLKFFFPYRYLNQVLSNYKAVCLNTTILVFVRTNQI